MKALFKITVKKEFMDECMKYITDHTNYCKTEPGNLCSEAFRSVDDPRVVYLISEWDTPEHKKMHVESPADAAFIQKMQGKEAAPVEIFRWTQLA